MKKSKQLWRRFYNALGRIHLVDRCLLLFMFILLLQSAYSLIAPEGVFPESSHIDIIIRTSAASIFGYFLSANFIEHSSVREDKTNVPSLETQLLDSPAPQSEAPQYRIGFASPASSSSLELGNTGPSNVETDKPKTLDALCLQIITASAIGIFCLVILILVRDFANWDATVNPSVTATVAQLRDFVSGSVGFLLGCPTRNPSKPT